MHITCNGANVQLPDFLVAGTGRSGTSSLYFYLREHPEIYMPEFKEPHFFNFIGQPSPHHNMPPWTIHDYANLFASAGQDQLIGEASASYLYYFEESIRNIQMVYGERYRHLKIMVILRNPIERAWSYYMLGRRRGYEKDYFEMIKDYNQGGKKIFHDFIRSGLYCDQLLAYLQAFPHFRIILFEELQQQPECTVRKIFEYLGVRDKTYLPQNVKTVYNASGGPKNRLLAPVYNFLFMDNRVKKLLKPLVPYRMRQNIKTSMSQKILDKKLPPDEIQDHLVQTFEPTISALLHIIVDPQQQSTIKGWLKRPTD